MSGRLLFFLLYFGGGSLFIGAGLAQMAVYSVKIVLARGDASIPRWRLIKRWKSGTPRMLNGRLQFWRVATYAITSLCFLFTASTSAYRLIYGNAAGERAVFGWILFTVFTLAMVIIPITALKLKGAVAATLELPDPLEMAAQQKVLRQVIVDLKHEHAESDRELIEKLEPVLQVLGQFREFMDSTGTPAEKL